MQKDYKMFPPSVDWDNIIWSTRRAQMDFPVQVISKCDFFFFFFLYYLNASFVEYYLFYNERSIALIS